MTVQSTHGWIAVSVDKNLKGKSAGADAAPVLDPAHRAPAPLINMKSRMPPFRTFAHLGLASVGT